MILLNEILSSGQGEGDILIQARFKDAGQARNFVRHRLPAVPGIKVTRFVLVPSILRNIDSWVPLAEDFGLQKTPDQDTDALEPG